MSDSQQLLTALSTEHFTLFAFSSAIAVINGVVGGGAMALALAALVDASLGICVLAGVATAVASVIGWIRYADVLLDARAAEVRPMFPTPGRSHPTG